MMIPDEIRKCVGFLQYKGNNQEIYFAGTFFFVAVPLPGTERAVAHAVTARHVIEGIRAHDQRIHLRLNHPEHGAGIIDAMDVDDWYFHPNDDTVDVAVSKPWFWEESDHRAYQIGGFIDDEFIVRERIGIGDETFIVGLFPMHPGKQKNIPIARVGNIAAMPEEPVTVTTLYWTDKTEMEGYLIEARSIGGLSGSPVFAHLGMMRNIDGELRFNNIPGGAFFLLGLVHGHWNLPISELDATAQDRTQDRINTGIAIVVPAKKILEVINQPKLKEMRDQILMEIIKTDSANHG